MMTTFYNDSSDVWVRVNPPEFVIIGDAETVSDSELLAMSNGVRPFPWREVTINDLDGIYAEGW